MTIKDIIKFLISDQTDRELHEILIDEAMTKRLTRTNKINSVIDCTGLMPDHGNTISSLIVVEEDYWEQSELPLKKKIQLLGIITSTDFARFFSENCRGYVSVKDYMSESVLTISTSEKVSRVVELMAEKNISRLVVNYSDGLLGILTETDISRIILAIRSKTLRSVYKYPADHIFII